MPVPMQVVVCVKWVDLRPEIDPLTGSVTTDSRFSGAGPADLAALEWGLRLAEQQGGTVTAVTFGPMEAEPMLRDALAAGATRAVLLQHEGDGNMASRKVADRLASICGDADLVCCGLHSLDRGTGSVPAFIAGALGLPQALGLVSASSLSSDAPEGAGGATPLRAPIVVERRLDHGRRERLRVSGRCVLSFEGGVELRRAALTATLAAKSAVVELIGSREPSRVQGSGTRVQPPEPAVVATGPYRPRAKVKPAPEGSTRERVASLISAGPDGAKTAGVRQLEPAEAAAHVVERLLEWGYIEPPPPGGKADAPDETDL